MGRRADGPVHTFTLLSGRTGLLRRAGLVCAHITKGCWMMHFPSDRGSMLPNWGQSEPASYITPVVGCQYARGMGRFLRCNDSSRLLCFIFRGGVPKRPGRIVRLSAKSFRLKTYFA